MGLGLLSGCANELPTATSEELVPVEARTVEIDLPFGEVAEDLRVLGGFGRPADLGYGLVARDFRDTLDARTLVRFSDFPTSVQVDDTTGTTREDSTLTFVGGRVVVRFDTTDVGGESGQGGLEPVVLWAGATTTSWHPLTAGWELAVDTVGDTRPWPEPGGGPVEPLDSAEWNPVESDSVVLRVDSATVAAWSDDTNDARGLRLELQAPGRKLRLRNVSLEVEVRPSVNPDTTVFAGVQRRRITFIYTPFPDPSPGGLRFGGAPAWRTVFRMSLPETVAVPSGACPEPECSLRLTPESLNSASLVLRSRRSPTVFQPEDTMAMDVRPVLRPALLPKSPLGESLGRSQDRALAPELFGSAAGQIVELPITAFVRNLIRGETDTGGAVHPTVALLSSVEPGTIGFAEFFGPGSESPPVLRLIVTQDDGVTLP